jgi:hypothetical protein
LCRYAEVDGDAFNQAALQKLLWASIFWLLCEVHGSGAGSGGGGATVGEVIENPVSLEHVRGGAPVYKCVILLKKGFSAT